MVPRWGDIHLHDICTEFHRKQSVYACSIDVSNCRVGWSLLKRLGARNLKVFSIMPVNHCTGDEGGGGHYGRVQFWTFINRMFSKWRNISIMFQEFFRTMQQLSNLLHVISVGVSFYNAEVVTCHFASDFTFSWNFSICCLLFLIAVLLCPVSTFNVLP